LRTLFAEAKYATLEQAVAQRARTLASGAFRSEPGLHAEHLDLDREDVIGLVRRLGLF
jgi:hypothetical protein